MSPTHSNPLVVRDLGRLPYVDALAIQREVHAAVVANESPATLLLVEHDPVITVSRRKAAGEHVLADTATLRREGVDVQPTDRGGDVTYHGPGQLVAYPIVRLKDITLTLTAYIRTLEQIAIDTLAAFEIAAATDPPNTGVWVQPPAPSPQPPAPLPGSKIAAIGVRCSRGTVLHGLALNVTTHLPHFNLIVPCGLDNRNVTSMHDQLGDATPAMPEVKRVLADRLAARLGRRITT